MSERAELTVALGRHPAGPAHLEHGSATLGTDGRPARRTDRDGKPGDGPADTSSDGRAGAVRWDYAATQMVAWCGCGWVGEPHAQRKAAGAGTGASRHDEWRRLHRPVLAAMEGEWEDHVHQVLPTLGIYEARVRLEAAEKGLDEAVGDSRRRGASWADVGVASALGKKVAHARWGKGRDVLLPRELSKGGRPRKPRPAAAGTAADDKAADKAAETPSPTPTSAPEDRTQTGAQPPGQRGERRGRRRTREQVHRLAQALSQRHGLEVEAAWQGTRSRDGRRGGWTLQWRGGPSRADMRTDAALVVDEDPDLAGLKVDKLGWILNHADADDAALVLEWLRTHPGEGDRIRHLDYDELPGWPEHLPADLRAHGATLAAAGWGYQHGGAAADALRDHAASGGYDAVAAWLTELADRQDADVVDLAAHRAGTTVTSR